VVPTQTSAEARWFEEYHYIFQAQQGMTPIHRWVVVRWRLGHRSAYRDQWRQQSEVEASNSSKATACARSAKTNNHIQMTSLRCEVKDMGFYQHRKTVPDGRSCPWLSQFSEVFYSNPDCKTQCEDLPYSDEYPTLGYCKGIGSCDRAVICVKENDLF
jgi:hypothetical protein